MNSYLLKKKKKKKKKGVRHKRYGPEVGIKTRCNITVWYHVSLCIEKDLLTRLTELSATKNLLIN